MFCSEKEKINATQVLYFWLTQKKRKVSFSVYVDGFCSKLSLGSFGELRFSLVRCWLELPNNGHSL